MKGGGGGGLGGEVFPRKKPLQGKEKVLFGWVVVLFPKRGKKGETKRGFQGIGVVESDLNGFGALCDVEILMLMFLLVLLLLLLL